MIIITTLIIVLGSEGLKRNFDSLLIIYAGTFRRMGSTGVRTYAGSRSRAQASRYTRSADEQFISREALELSFY